MLKIIGAGFARTGTTSVKAALEQIGVSKVYHMRDIIENPAHVPTWVEAARGLTIDWDKLFEGYQATIDFPASAFYKQLMIKYPAAKVLLTWRDPEVWYESMTKTVIWKYRNDEADPNAIVNRPVVREVVWEGIFKGRIEDKSFAIDVYNKHCEEVKMHVPTDRLLVFDPKDGWGPLCKFVGTPIPESPFPHKNESATFRSRVIKA